MDYRRDPLLVPVGRAQREATQRTGEAAERLGVGRSTPYQLVAGNAVPVERVGRLVRIPRDALLR